MESFQAVWYSSSGSKFRRMFYLLSPNESSFQHLEDVPEYEREANSFFMGFLLVETFLSLVLGDHRVRISDGITSISAGILSRIPLIYFKSVFLNLYQWIYSNYHFVELQWNSPYTWLFTLFAVDFSYYWFHRLTHETNLFWLSHQVHHSSEDYNFSTATRQSIFQVYFGWLFYTPMALCIPLPIYLVHEQLNTLYQFWIHTQYIGSLGPLEYIINTPSHHRVHHGRNPYCINKNYGGSLIIWDRLFGTFEAEKPQEEVVYGLVFPIKTFEPFRVQFEYCKGFIKKWKQYGSFSLLFREPAWFPGQDPNNVEFPKVKYPVVKHTTQVSNWCSLYVLAHFTAVTSFFILVLTIEKTMSRHSILAIMLFIIYSLSCFGNIFDKRSYAVYMEMLRCGFVMCISQYVNLQFLVDFCKLIPAAIPWFYGASILLWLPGMVLGSKKRKPKKVTFKRNGQKSE
ncbi:alkylglycerol monooxygenase-like [Argonauta hians]